MYKYILPLGAICALLSGCDATSATPNRFDAFREKARMAACSTSEGVMRDVAIERVRAFLQGKSPGVVVTIDAEKYCTDKTGS